MFRISALLPAAGLFALVGCVEPPPPAPPPVYVDDVNACGAASLQGLVGSPLRTFSQSDARGPVRILAPGGIMTLDLRRDRLNVEHNNRQIITRIFCG